MLTTAGQATGAAGQQSASKVAVLLLSSYHTAPGLRSIGHGFQQDKSFNMHTDWEGTEWARQADKAGSRASTGKWWNGAGNGKPSQGRPAQAAHNFQNFSSAIQSCRQTSPDTELPSSPKTKFAHQSILCPVQVRKRYHVKEQAASGGSRP